MRYLLACLLLGLCASVAAAATLECQVTDSAGIPIITKILPGPACGAWVMRKTGHPGVLCQVYPPPTNPVLTTSAGCAHYHTLAQTAEPYDGMADCGMPGATKAMCDAVHRNQCWTLLEPLMVLYNDKNGFRLSRAGLEADAIQKYGNDQTSVENLRAFADQIYDGVTPGDLVSRCVRHYSP